MYIVLCVLVHTYVAIMLLQDGWTVLHYACRYEHTEVVKLLISNDADISAVDNVCMYICSYIHILIIV